jgi:hypothetical protein
MHHAYMVHGLDIAPEKMHERFGIFISGNMSGSVADIFTVPVSKRIWVSWYFIYA